MKKQAFCILLCLASHLCIAAPPKKDLTIYEVIDRVDKMFRSQTSKTELSMTVQNPHYERTMTMTMWSKGMDETFIRILSPKKNKGITTLRKGKEMWNFFPKINKVMKVPPSMMIDSWMGSDFTNDDLVRESSLIKDFAARYLSKDPKYAEQYVVELTAKENVATVWPKVVLYMDRSTLLPTEQQFFDEHQKLVRVITFSKPKIFSNKTIPSEIRVIPQNKKGHQTIIRYENAEFDISLADDLFSLRHLRRNH